MDTKILKDIGLTEGEIKVYFALLKLGQTKTGNLAVQAGVSSSKVYKILDRLEKKGLAGHVLKQKVKYFTATHPKRLLDVIEEKESQLEKKKNIIQEMLPDLEKQQIQSLDTTQATIYDGFQGVTNFFKSILTDLKAGETYYVIGAGYGDNVQGFREFFHKHHAKRALKKIKVKMLANFDEKETLVKTIKKHSEIRYLPKYLITNMEIVFYKNKTFIILLTEDPKGFLIESNEAVKNFQTYFNAFWKIAKP